MPTEPNNDTPAPDYHPEFLMNKFPAGCFPSRATPSNDAPSPGAPTEWMRKAAEEHYSGLDGTEKAQAAMVALLARHAPACDADKPAWRTMEDAPRDGTEILVCGPGAGNTGPLIAIVTWECGAHMFSSLTKCPSDECAFEWFGTMGCTYGIEFTHWQPLPAPPAAAKEGE